MRPRGENIEYDELADRCASDRARLQMRIGELEAALKFQKDLLAAYHKLNCQSEELLQKTAQTCNGELGCKGYLYEVSDKKSVDIQLSNELQRRLTKIGGLTDVRAIWRIAAGLEDAALETPVNPTMQHEAGCALLYGGGSCSCTPTKISAKSGE
jgi:hypothetical protein